MNAANPPIIVVGMHRSGTSMVTRALDAFGVFLGARKEINHEALFFLRLNEWLLEQVGASWDRPALAAELLDVPAVRGIAVDALRGFVTSPRAVRYLGLARYMRCRGLARMTEPWGFKDPRATLTLPLWLDLFPEARVVFVHRHGVDVAHSLVTRMERQLEATRRRLAEHGRLPERVARVGARIADSVRFRSLDAAFALWEEYAAFAVRNLDAIPGDRLFTVGYEALLAEPRRGVEALASFVGVDPAPAVVDRLCDGVDATRAFAWRSDPRLVAFAESVGGSAAMRQLGYDAVAPEEPAVAIAHGRE